MFFSFVFACFDSVTLMISHQGNTCTYRISVHDEGHVGFYVMPGTCYMCFDVLLWGVAEILEFLMVLLYKIRFPSTFSLCRTSG